MTSENPLYLDPRLSDLFDALRSQETTLAEITDAIDGHGDTVSGLILVLRALIDVALSEEQRAMLVSHLEMTTAGDRHRAKRSIVDVLLD